jgi:hypothetical protein
MYKGNSKYWTMKNKTSLGFDTKTKTTTTTTHSTSQKDKNQCNLCHCRSLSHSQLPLLQDCTYLDHEERENETNI